MGSLGTRKRGEGRALTRCGTRMLVSGIFKQLRTVVGVPDIFERILENRLHLKIFFRCSV